MSRASATGQHFVTESSVASLSPERLLVYEAGTGWEPICEFLDLEVPAVSYPRSNTRTTFDEESGMTPDAS